MARAHWRLVGNPAADASARTLAALPGAQGVVFITDGHGDRVAVGQFATPQQAERAQVAAGLKATGTTHTAVTPGVPLAWINYSGRLKIDQKVSDCTLAAARR
jgi:hypothetical protein